MHTKHNTLFIEGIYSCPLDSDGYKVCSLGNKFNLIASETSVKEPEINACEAIIAANVEIIIPNIKSGLGIIWKNGFKSSIALKDGLFFAANIHAPCPK